MIKVIKFYITGPDRKSNQGPPNEGLAPSLARKYYTRLNLVGKYNNTPLK